jgi:hypothetical protein
MPPPAFLREANASSSRIRYWRPMLGHSTSVRMADKSYPDRPLVAPPSNSERFCQRRIGMIQDYQIKELSEEEFTPLFKEHRDGVFEDTHSYMFPDLLSDAEKERSKNLAQLMGTPYKLFLGVFDAENKFVGWSWGFQESGTVYYMVNSAVLKDHRRKGL